MKSTTIIYWVATGIMCAIFLFSAMNYLFNYEVIKGIYIHLGFPTWLIYPSAIAKLLGITAVLSKKSTFLKEWAYAGFFFDAVLAFTAHLIAQDGGWLFSGVVLVALVISRIYDEKLFAKK